MAKQNTKQNTTTIGSGLTRGKTNGYHSEKLWAKREQKRRDGLDRQAEHDSLTVQEKITKAQLRRGESKKELARLQKQLEQMPSAKVEPKKLPSVELKELKETKAKAVKPKTPAKATKPKTPRVKKVKSTVTKEK
jgi:hypothetical protein